MPKQSQRANYNAFIKGIITEASPLNFPDNSSLDELNFVLNNDGSRQRRLGMDYEVDFNYHGFADPSSVFNNTNLNTFLWQSVSGDSQLNFVVVQGDTFLYFFNDSFASISSDGFVGSIVLAGFPTATRYSFAAVDGNLVVAGGVGDLKLVSFNEATTTFTVGTHRLTVRDQWGLEETINASYENDPSFRGPLNDQHYYNLQNQSWGIQRKDNAGTYVDPIAYYDFNSVGNVSPSNSEQVWPGLQFFSDGTPTGTYERLYSNLWYELIGSSTSAAKGYFIIDLLDRSNSRNAAIAANKAKYPQVGGSTTIASDSTLLGPSIVCDFSGRIFYSGFNGALVNGDARSPILNSYIVFSQLVKSRADFFKCYQAGDPTSRDTADLVDTDGGFIRISGAKNIISMQNLGNYLVVFASNGVWSVTGDNTNSGFSATNYKVTKLSSFGAVSPTSIVAEGATCYYWAEDGVYLVSKNQFGDLVVNNITLQTIQSLYQDIPKASKIAAKGIYDQFTNETKWIYKTGTAFTSDSMTFELIFNSSLGAWIKNRIASTSDNSIEVFGIFNCTSFYQNPADQTSDVLGTKYLIANSAGRAFTFGYYNNVQFRDWFIKDGVGIDAKAYVLTGTATAGDPAVDKQIPYLMMYFNRTEQGVDSNFQPLLQSSCMFRAQWDFANSIISNRWSPLRQSYRYRKTLLVEGLDDTYDNGLSVIYSKNKLRGKGKAFSLYFETEPFKDCQILGWNLTVNSEQIT